MARKVEHNGIDTVFPSDQDFYHFILEYYAIRRIKDIIYGPYHIYVHIYIVRIKFTTFNVYDICLFSNCIIQIWKKNYREFGSFNLD